MKNILLTLGLFLSITAFADIEYSPAQQSKATTEEINQSRACFKELEVHGCGDPGEDMTHFRSCLNNAYPGLTDSCKVMMKQLYGTK